MGLPRRAVDGPTSAARGKSKSVIHMMRQFFNVSDTDKGKRGAREARRIVGGEEALSSDGQADVRRGVDDPRLTW